MLRAACGNQTFSDYELLLAYEVLLETRFVEGETNYFSHEKYYFERMNTCL
jgi:hypothetical protein